MFYYIFAYNYLLHSYNLNFQKETITLFTPPPSRVITLGWINLIFLTVCFERFGFLVHKHTKGHFGKNITLY